MSCKSSWRIFLFLIIQLTLVKVMAIGHRMNSTLLNPVFQFAAEREYPEFLLDTSGLINYLGYPCEIHNVITEDGYILTVFRIPYGKSGGDTKKSSKTKPVYVQHGLLGSSDDFVLNMANQSLGCMLADAGFDVWLGNARGNKYSLRHAGPIRSEKEFFDFSFDEVGKYDMPAVIDYILKNTSNTQLQLIGLSMGVTTTLAMLSTKTKYNIKVSHFHAMGPVAWLRNGKSPFRHVAPYEKLFQLFLDAINYYYFLPNYDFIKLVALGCGSIYPDFCKRMGGSDTKQLNDTQLPIVYSHFPSGTSTNTIIQFSQETNSGKFQHFDYGVLGNLKKYGQTEPPEYDVSKVSTKVSLYWGENDDIADPQDVAYLKAQLPNCVDDYRVPDPLYSHMDFSVAIHNPQLLYNYLISRLEK